MGRAVGQEVLRFSSENPFGDFQSLLFHARQRGTGHGLRPHRPRRAALLQDKVVVGSGVHGIEDVGVVGDSELCDKRTEPIVFTPGIEMIFDWFQSRFDLI